ncbi:Uncharacterised protein [Salmonella sp. NCTC 11881]|nr:Uncharacterised protein [Salmonella sp. NCTC 11881]
MSNVIVRGKAYYLAKIDATERQWLSVILRDKTWDNRERVASFFAAESGYCL